jgi:DMSO/TMAO reductase YedYZ heme-binding membrane subunit
VWWFVARSSGIIAWALLTLSVVWGLLLSTKVSATRIAARKLRPAWILDLHRHLGGLAVIFTAIHLIGIVADSYVTFGWADIFVPMASEWKPGAVAFGVVSLYLLVAIEVTSLAIRRLPRTAWRWVHRTSFVLYATATYHGILAGTDAGNQWFRVASWISIVVVVVLTVRLLVVLRRKSVSDRRRPETPAAAPEVVPLAGPLPNPVVVASPPPSPTPSPMPSPTPTSMPKVLPPAMPLVAAIPPLPGTVNEHAAPVGAVTVKPASAGMASPQVTPPQTQVPSTGTPTSRPSLIPPPPPPRPPHRPLAEVSSGGRGGGDPAPPQGTT